MSSLSAAVKRIAFSSIFVLFAASVNLKSLGIALIGVLAGICFWLLDSYYLALEKDLRNRWDLWVLDINEGVFDSNKFMNLKAKPDRFFLKSAFGNLNLFTYYGLIMLVLLGLFLF